MPRLRVLQLKNYLVKLYFKEMHKGENFEHEMAGEEVI